MPRAQLATPLESVANTSAPDERLSSGRIAARALADRSDAAVRLSLARSFCEHVVAEWWRCLATTGHVAVPLREQFQAFKPVRLPETARTLARTLGKAAAERGAETAAYHIGLIYTGMLPAEHRSEFGVYYTPPALTARLIEKATDAGVDWTRCRVLDPACGGGAFLAPVAQRILTELPRCSPRILIENISNRLQGYEIDPFAAWLSQVALDAVLLPVTRKTGRRLPVLVTVCNSLAQDPPSDRFDLVIGNPPYGRVRLAPADRSRYKRSLFGHANLYGLFTDMALHHTKDDGVIAYLTPTSFLAGEYFKNLRAVLRCEAPPVNIDFVSARKGVFDDVLQETLLATYKRGASSATVTVSEIKPERADRIKISNAGAFALPTDISQPWILPRNTPQVPIVKALAVTEHRLRDWGYSVSTGPLVWNRHKGQLAESSGRNRLPLIWAEAVTAEGKFIWRAEKRNHAPYFELRQGDDWLVTSDPCVLLQRTTAKEQSRRLIATALPKSLLNEHGAVVIENHLNMLRPITGRPKAPADVLAAFLNSAVADRAFRCVSGSVAVSAYELESLPMPNPDDLEDVARLVRKKSDRGIIDAVFERLYRNIL
ncbi:MAG: N-6 DNA methylase [Dongiaceae bacterium]